MIAAADEDKLVAGTRPRLAAAGMMRQAAACIDRGVREVPDTASQPKEHSTRVRLYTSALLSLACWLARPHWFRAATKAVDCHSAA